MKVEIWSDVVCPWCYIGKRRFERALSEFEAADEVEIVWRSFQLNPDYPVGGREAHDEHLARKLGATPAQVQQLNERVVALAAAEGLDYHFEICVTVNTFDAHRVTLGITGVPFFVLDRRYGISGAQPAPLFLEALRTARGEAAGTSPA